MVEEVGGIHYHHLHTNYTWVGKYLMGSGRLYMGRKAAKRAVSHGKKTAFANVRFALYGESLGAVPSSGQPARRILFSLCLVCMHVLDGWHGRGWTEYRLRTPREPSPA